MRLLLECPNGCQENEARRLISEVEDFRSAYAHDVDRIVYSLSYLRYADKTQVFSVVKNDHISKRMLHVQLVSRVARTISRALGLNEDLTEAIAMGHDIGHVPFGHVGEKILNEISLKHNQGYFRHNIQSVRTLMCLENNGCGLNLTYQTLDGIMCHNGEELQQSYYSKSDKTQEEFLAEYNNSYHQEIINLRAQTKEGCVVRISDVIAYLGRDIEDAIRLDVITITDVPITVKRILGVSNTNIVNNVVHDIIKNSDLEKISMSSEVYQAVVVLQEFNYKYIYNKAHTKKQLELYKKMFEVVFANALNDLKKHNKQSSIYKVYYSNMIDDYKRNNTLERIAIDYIAGMTDNYFINEYEKIIVRNEGVN